jgi:hypothetical protein
MTSLITSALSYLSKVCGLESIHAFPAGHIHARTHWDPAYFDIAYGTSPEQIERTLCAAIDNTPSIFAHIGNPTPRMQRSLLAVLEQSVRRNDSHAAAALVGWLIAAYASAHVREAVPGLRAVIERSAQEDGREQVRAILAFLADMRAPFDVIDA